MSLQPSTGVGVRGAVATVLRDAAVEDTAWLSEQISQRDWEVQALASFRTRLNRAERDAVRLYFELRKMVGSQEDAMELAKRALNIVSIEQGKRLLDMARGVDGMTDQELESKAVTFLRQAGWTCLPPDAEVGTRASGQNGETKAASPAMTPGVSNGH